MMPEIPLIPGGKSGGGMFPVGAALLLAAAGLLGCLAIWSARTFAGEPMVFVIRQLWWIGPGIVLFLLSSAVPFRFSSAQIPIVTAGMKISEMNGNQRFSCERFARFELMKSSGRNAAAELRSTKTQIKTYPVGFRK